MPVTAAQLRTTATVAKFLKCFDGVEHFCIGVFRRAPKSGMNLPAGDVASAPEEVSDRMHRIEPLTAAQVLAMVPALMAWNKDKAEIYFTPIGEHGFLLIDDMDAGGVALLRSCGGVPVAVVETSPGLHHVWLRLSRAPVSPLVRRWLARWLAREYGPHGADKNSASIDHFGRLPDFCNYKPKRVDKVTGESPWVKLIQHNPGRPAAVGAEWIAAATGALEKEAAALAAAEVALAARRAAAPHRPAMLKKTTSESLGEEYQAMVDAMEPLTEFLRNDGSGPDGSRIDWRACMALLRAGYPREDVEAAAIEYSLRVSDRNAAHHASYSRLTIQNAWNSEIVRHTLGAAWRFYPEDQDWLDRQAAKAEKQRANSSPSNE